MEVMVRVDVMVGDSKVLVDTGKGVRMVVVVADVTTVIVVVDTVVSELTVVVAVSRTTRVVSVPLVRMPSMIVFVKPATVSVEVVSMAVKAVSVNVSVVSSVDVDVTDVRVPSDVTTTVLTGMAPVAE